MLAHKVYFLSFKASESFDNSIQFPNLLDAIDDSNTSLVLGDSLSFVP